MRKDVQEIFRNTPHSKQVMMFSATLSKEIRPVCKKFMQDVSSYQKYSLSYDSVVIQSHCWEMFWKDTRMFWKKKSLVFARNDPVCYRDRNAIWGVWKVLGFKTGWEGGKGVKKMSSNCWKYLLHNQYKLLEADTWKKAFDT